MYLIWWLLRHHNNAFVWFWWLLCWYNYAGTILVQDITNFEWYKAKTCHIACMTKYTALESIQFRWNYCSQLTQYSFATHIISFKTIQTGFILVPDGITAVVNLMTAFGLLAVASMVRRVFLCIFCSCFEKFKKVFSGHLPSCWAHFPLLAKIRLLRVRSVSFM